MIRIRRTLITRRVLFTRWLGSLAVVIRVERSVEAALVAASYALSDWSVELGTDVNLYALVFGESVLNDAMAISLYRTMSLVRSHMSSDQNIFMVVVNSLSSKQLCHQIKTYSWWWSALCAASSGRRLLKLDCSLIDDWGIRSC